MRHPDGTIAYACLGTTVGLTRLTWQAKRPIDLERAEIDAPMV
jgi:hypothetical protein